MIDLRYPTALQMVLSLAVAHEQDVRCTSAELAAGLGANPVLVRKLLVPLAHNGIVISTAGKNGGVRLGRLPEQITLLDVYKAAVEEKRLFATRPNVPGLCVVSRNIGRFFGGLAEEIEGELSQHLSRKTLAHSLAVIRELDNMTH
ncbi:RrF2 family transcriptional regulator [Sphingomonas sp. UYP23]